MKEKTASRLTYMDVAKGIGILCVIAGHMGNSMVNRFIFSFHMPLFFLISGFFMSDKDSASVILNKRIRQLIPPYVFTCLSVIAISSVKGIIEVLVGNETLSQVGRIILEWIYASIYGAGTSHDLVFPVLSIGAIWFLLATIWSSWLSKYAMTTPNTILFVLIVSMLGHISSFFVWLPLSLQCGMTATVFVYLGIQLRKTDFFNKPNNIQIPCIIVSFILWINEIVFTTPWLDIAQNQFPNGAFDFIGGGAQQFA